MATSHSYSMHFSKQVALPCCSKLWLECWLIKGVWLQIRIYYTPRQRKPYGRNNALKTCKTPINSNKNIKMSSFKNSESIQKKEGGPDRSVSDNQSSSVTLHELAMKARKDTVISSFSKAVIH